MQCQLLKLLIWQYLHCNSFVIYVFIPCYLTQICAASQKKSLAGLDNVTSEGASAFENLEEIVQKMASLGKYNCGEVIPMT